jgi:pimeloyl-ACP methyl ester carboxylesterase
VLTWDLPGHGTSGPARDAWDATIEAQPAILARVMDAAGIDRAVQVGFSVGCQVALETARQLPERVSALVLLLGGARNALSNTRLPVPHAVLLSLLRNTPDPLFAVAFRQFARLADLPASLRAARALGVLGPSATDGDLREVTQHLATVDPESIRRMALSAEKHDAFDTLAALKVPLLIVTGDRDPFAPMELVGEPMHRAAPHSELVRLHKGTHTALLDQAERIGDVVERFLGRLALSPPMVT